MGIRIKAPTPWSTITGFVYETEVTKVMAIYLRGAGVAPPIFNWVKHNILTHATGFYIGLSAQLSESDIEELRKYVRGMEVE